MVGGKNVEYEASCNYWNTHNRLCQLKVPHLHRSGRLLYFRNNLYGWWIRKRNNWGPPRTEISRLTRYTNQILYSAFLFLSAQPELSDPGRSSCRGLTDCPFMDAGEWRWKWLLAGLTSTGFVEMQLKSEIGMPVSNPPWCHLTLTLLPIYGSLRTDRRSSEMNLTKIHHPTKYSMRKSCQLVHSSCQQERRGGEEARQLHTDRLNCQLHFRLTMLSLVYSLHSTAS